jgi:hypothetical protein
MSRMAHFIGGGKFSHFNPLVDVYPLISRCQNKTSHGGEHAQDLCTGRNCASPGGMKRRCWEQSGCSIESDGRRTSPISPVRQCISAKSTRPLLRRWPLAAINNPAPVTFVGQANVAHGPQQVNNAGPAPADLSRAGKPEIQRDKLLEVHSDKRLDAKAASTTSCGNSRAGYAKSKGSEQGREDQRINREADPEPIVPGIPLSAPRHGRLGNKWETIRRGLQHVGETLQEAPRRKARVRPSGIRSPNS